MRILRSILPKMALLFCLPAIAHDPRDLAGQWIIQPPSPPGIVVLQTVTFSDEKGGALRGSAFDSSKEPDTSPVTEIHVSGDTVSFTAGDEKYSSLWRGRFDNANELRMTMFIVNSGETMPDHTATFRRSSLSQVAELKARLPRNLIFDKLPLPQLRELPPNGLAKTPPMGWSSWNRFMESIDDKTVRETAEALVSSGLRDAGYSLVEVDDGWQGRRDKNGTLHSNVKFPDMKGLADYVHSKGLKFGIYTAMGPLSCGGYTGSYGYEVQDAQTFARWGVDFVMNDFCRTPYKNIAEHQALYQKMGEALRATGRPIVYKVASKAYVASALIGVDNSLEQSIESENWGRKVGANLWRTGIDLCVGDRWRAVSDRFERDGKREDAGPGGWNDADNLVIGLEGVTPEYRSLTIEESRTHMTLWVMLASPLILGNDARQLTDEVKGILLNKEVIAVDQDSLGKQGRRVSREGDAEIWTKSLSEGSLAVALFNRGDVDSRIIVTWKTLGLEGTQRVRDLWRHADLGERSSGYSALVPSHASVLLRLKVIDGGS